MIYCPGSMSLVHVRHKAKALKLVNILWGAIQHWQQDGFR